MRKFLIGVLLSVAIACALALSSSSTVKLANDNGVQGWVQWTAVGLLEVVVLAGTYSWVTAKTKSAKAWSIIGVVASSVVTLIGGVHTYHAFGIVAPIGLILTVHIIATIWNARDPEREAKKVVERIEQMIGLPVELQNIATASGYYVYRFLSDSDEVVFAGRSRNLYSRISKHRNDEPWWDEVAIIRVEMYEKLEDAEAAQSTIIREEAPKYNKVSAQPTMPAIEFTEPPEPTMPVQLPEPTTETVPVHDEPQTTTEVVPEPEPPTVRTGEPQTETTDQDQDEPRTAGPNQTTRVWSVPEMLADLKWRGISDPKQRAVRDYYGVGAAKAKKVLEELSEEVAA